MICFPGAIASVGRVLGNRTTLLKYLNPHLFAVVSELRGSAVASIHLLDSSSGTLVHHIEVEDVDSRVQISVILRDNWIIYTYKSLSNQLDIVISLEMYEGLAVDTFQSTRSVERANLSADV